MKFHLLLLLTLTGLASAQAVSLAKANLSSCLSESSKFVFLFDGDSIYTVQSAKDAQDACAKIGSDWVGVTNNTKLEAAPAYLNCTKGVDGNIAAADWDGNSYNKTGVMMIVNSTDVKASYIGQWENTTAAAPLCRYKPKPVATADLKGCSSGSKEFLVPIDGRFPYEVTNATDARKACGKIGAEWVGVTSATSAEVNQVVYNCARGPANAATASWDGNTYQGLGLELRVTSLNVIPSYTEWRNTSNIPICRRKRQNQVTKVSQCSDSSSSFVFPMADNDTYTVNNPNDARKICERINAIWFGVLADTVNDAAKAYFTCTNNTGTVAVEHWNGDNYNEAGAMVTVNSTNPLNSSVTSWNNTFAAPLCLPISELKKKHNVSEPNIVIVPRPESQQGIDHKDAIDLCAKANAVLADVKVGLDVWEKAVDKFNATYAGKSAWLRNFDATSRIDSCVALKNGEKPGNATLYSPKDGCKAKLDAAICISRGENGNGGRSPIELNLLVTIKAVGFEKVFNNKTLQKLEGLGTKSSFEEQKRLKRRALDVEPDFASEGAAGNWRYSL